MDKSLLNKLLDGDIRCKEELSDDVRSALGYETRSEEYRQLSKEVCFLWVEKNHSSSNILDQLIANTLMSYMTGDDPFKPKSKPAKRPKLSFGQNLIAWAYSRRYSQIKAANHLGIKRGGVYSRIEKLMEEFRLPYSDWKSPKLQALEDFVMRVYCETDIDLNSRGDDL